MTRISKHDKGVLKLASIISEDYDYLERNVKIYSDKERTIAEADLIGFKDGYIDIYEVKCSYRPVKAKSQLRKLKRLLSANRKVRHTYFYPMNVEQLILLSL